MPCGAPLERANLDNLFEHSKQIAIISENPGAEFASFVSQFRLIEAAGGLVENAARDEVLMILRNGRWDLPKGKLEAGETLECCALREVQEECGIDHLLLEGFLCYTFHLYKLAGIWVLKRSAWWRMSYSGQGAELSPQTEEGIVRVEWVDTTLRAKYLENSYPTIRDCFREYDLRELLVINF